MRLKKTLMNCGNSPERRTKTFQGHHFRAACIIFCCCLFCVLNCTPASSAQETSGIVKSVQAKERVNTLPWLGLILFGCFLLAGKRAYTQICPKHSISANDVRQLREARQRLLQTLAELDEKYESGRLDKQAYTIERTRRKQQLVELTALCKKVDSGKLKVGS